MPQENTKHSRPVLGSRQTKSGCCPAVPAFSPTFSASSWCLSAVKTQCPVALGHVMIILDCCPDQETSEFSSATALCGFPLSEPTRSTLSFGMMEFDLLTEERAGRVSYSLDIEDADHAEITRIQRPPTGVAFVAVVPAASGSAGRASSSPGFAHGDDSHDWSLWSFPPDAADPRA
jgi:hypothetical protein